MKINKIAAAGCVPFPQRFELTIPDHARIIAITGDNGAGKSTLLDLVYFALYGDTTKAGGAYSLFNSKNGVCELGFEYGGHDITIHRMVDGVNRKQRVFVWCDGVSLTEGKTTEASEAILSVFPVSESVFLAAVYNAQSQKGNPLEMSDGKRRELLADVLDFAEIDEAAALVVPHAESGKREWIELSCRMATIKTMVESFPLGDSDALMDDVAKTAQITQARDMELAEAQVNLANAVAQTGDLNEAMQHAARLRQVIDQRETQIKDLKTRIQNNQSHLLDRAIVIRDASRGWLNYQAAIEARKTELETLEKNSLDAQSRILSIKREWESVAYPYKMGSSMLDQHKQDAVLIDQVPCGGVQEYSGCPLLTNAITAKARIPEAEKAAQHLQQINADYLDLVSEAEQTAKQAIDVMSNARSVLVTLMKEAEVLKADADLIHRLEVAEDAIASYQQQICELWDANRIDHDELLRYESRINAASGSTNVVHLKNALAHAEDMLTLARAKETEARVALENHNQRAADRQAKERELEKLQDESHRVQLAMDNLGILSAAFGPKGIKALKIDAAGPGITEIANTLLAECFGPRFTLEIQTQRELASKRGELRECLEFMVTDNETGLISGVEQKSGGEQQLIREVISLALCIYSRAQSGVDVKTVIRDEACSALTEDNTVKYINMLAKACELGGLHQVFFVSHKQNTATMADCVVKIANGGVSCVVI